MLFAIFLYTEEIRVYVTELGYGPLFGIPITSKPDFESFTSFFLQAVNEVIIKCQNYCSTDGSLYSCTLNNVNI